VPVVNFTVGVGPLLKSFQVGSGEAARGRLPMRVDLRLLPLLGYVKPYVAPRQVWAHWEEQRSHAAAGRPPPPLPDLDPDEPPRSVVEHVSRARLVQFLGGGLAVNLVLAVGLLWAYENSPTGRAVTTPVAGRVPEDSVAARAGLREGDRFLSVGGEPVVGFFDVARRLAPLRRDGSAAAARDAPGSEVSLVVRRGAERVQLAWPVPAEPPTGDAAEAYGVLPPETWRVARVRDTAGGLRPGDEVRAFSGPRAQTVETQGPGAHAALHRTFSGSQGEPVTLVVRRPSGRLVLEVPPWRVPEGTGAPHFVPPFDFERLRERGPGAGLGEAVASVTAFGWNALVQLPRTMVEAVRSRPTKEERGWLLAQVRQDPWAGVRTFALVNAFLFFLNLVPVPPLDGFQLLRSGIEAAARRPLPERAVALAVRAGWVVLAVWLALNAVLVARDLVTGLL
jgi:membrane-associated protease RseP (regulator of RpoE activity)